MNYLLESLGYSIVVPVMIVWLLVSLSQSKSVQKPRLFKNDGFLHEKLGAGQAFIIVILIISLLAICERILFDLSRTLVPTYNYVDDLATIMVHVMFIVPVLVACIVVNILVGQHRQKYAVILMPYLVTTIVLTVQLIIEISIYFSNHHTKFELYVVLLCIIFIASYATWYIQNLYNKRLQEMKA